MMNIRNIIGVLILTGMFACSDSFLDVEPQTSLSTDMAIGNFADAQVALIGVYDALQSTANYYARNFVVTADITTDDLIIAPQNSGRFLEQYNFTVSPTTAFSAGLWNRAYNAINRANNIIEKVDIIDDATEDDLNHLLGQALSLRALAHFDLLRIYARPYSWDKGDSPGVPYMERATITSPERDQVGYVYEKIVDDLINAHELMRSSTTLSERVFMSKYAAKALLARVYLYMEEWQLAADFSNDVIEHSGYLLVTSDTYIESWSAEFTTESIFSLAMSNLDYSATDALGYIYLRDGYGDLRPSIEIRQLLEEFGGLRNEAFVRFDPIGEDYFVNKYPGRDNQPGLDNVPVLRLAEMYLIAAEAHANLNEDEEAQNRLNTIVQRANPDAENIDLTGDDLKSRIYLEKRLEFAFEGHRLFDISRRQEALNRSDCNAEVCFLPARDFRFVFPIPQREMDANPNMTQNPGYN